MDTIAQFLTSVRNASEARHKKVDVSASKSRIAISEILANQGYIKSFKLFRDGNHGILRLYLKYVERNKPVLQGLERISKPSHRVYVSHKEVPTILGGIGTAIVSTPKGILGDKDAREQKVGGEYMCKVW